MSNTPVVVVYSPSREKSQTEARRNVLNGNLGRKDFDLFMSPNASKVHKERKRKREGTGGGGPNDDEEDGDVRREMKAFKTWSKEIELLGAEQLPEKERRKFDSKRLTSLGGKPSKSPRCSPALGMGIKRKTEERAQIQLQEDVASGMAKLKGSGNKRKRQKEEERRKSKDFQGINASEGRYKNGVLFVTPLPKKAGAGGKRRSGSSSGEGLGFGDGDNRKRGSGTPKGKGKKKGGKQKKRKKKK
eukprot:TRINITY_DN22115_c0_g1_i1.p1 TRINITY_DN22115_c0_g1~~TRINITY_DN22115_c0_g1_i1.p1  ORF type:complete len:245 (+),score=62.96 TRINITY_DN22115_c0_g1_i1:84-818(+)